MSPFRTSRGRTDIIDILRKKRIPILFQFSAFIICFTLFLVAALMYFTLDEERRILTREREYIGRVLVSNLASGGKESLLLDDELYAFQIIDGMKKRDYDHDILYAFITDPSGRIVVHDDARRMGQVLDDSITAFTQRMSVPVMNRIVQNNRMVLDFAHPILDDASRKRIGTARIGLSSASVDRVVENAVRKALSAALVILLVGLAASLFWVRLVTRPIAEMARGAEIVGKGDLKYRFKVGARNEIGELAEIFNRMTGDLAAAQIELIAKHQLEHELDLARSIQSTLLPERIPASDKIEIAAFYRAALEVGGDYYDFIRVDDRHLGILIADVSGKSISGAFMMGITRAIVRSLAPADLSPLSVLARVNDVLRHNMKKGMFVTMLYAVLNLDTLKLRLASAGHDPLFHLKKGASAYRLVSPKGCALGVCRDQFREKLAEEEVALARGDLLALTTDGVTEATNPAGVLFGERRLFDFLVREAPQNVNFILQGLVSEIDRFYEGGTQSDDITMVMFKVL